MLTHDAPCVGARRSFSINGNYKLSTKDWQCKKRDGSVVPFEPHNISAALRKCFTSILPEGKWDGMVSRMTTAVINQLAAKKMTCPDVEEVQRLVIAQLWAEGLFDYAEHYQNYREERRRVRELETLDPAAVKLIEDDAKHFPSPLQYFQFLDKYARWNEAKMRRETWRECCNRVMGFFRKQPQLQAITDAEWRALDDGMYRQQASPAMRIVQMAGPALDRCNSGAFNCCYVACDDLRMFSEVLYLLMQGCGVGFSVESDYVNRLPLIERQKGGSPVKIVVEDSTEGWCDAYRTGVFAWVAGQDVEYDYSLVRPQGARLRTKGGRASGDGPLRQLLTFARSLFLSRQGKRLTTKDCHNLLCMTGKIVQVGGVRRASEISISDLDDNDMRNIKSGRWWEQSPWLDMANISAAYEEKPDAITFMEEWIALARSGSGERGIFNRAGLSSQIPARRKMARFGLNPCGEVILRSMETCNLSVVVARDNDTEFTLSAKVRLATIFGTLQSTLTNFKYLRPEWKENCDEERLLGVDITGQMDCPLLRPGAAGREELLQRLQKIALETNQALALRLGINQAAAATVVKPSGNSAVFFGCSSGLHARWSRFQVRRVRVGRYGPMAAFLRDEGVPHVVDPLNDSLLVFDFLPEPAPEGTPTRESMTAVQQLENVLTWKKHWTEHNPSATIYVGPEEWLELGQAVYKNFDSIGGLTFLPRNNGTYQAAPNEEISETEYRRRRKEFPDIHWAKLTRYETEDMTTSAMEPACVGGACEL